MNDEIQLLQSIYDENRAKFDITPWYRPLVKSRRKGDLLRSWASLRGAGLSHVRKPNTDNALVRWVKYNSEDIKIAALIVTGLAALVGLFTAIIISRSGPDPWDKPLPPGIHQRGYGFDIDKGVIDKKESGGGSAPFTSYDLCYRLPDSDGYGATIKPLPNGGIRINCVVGHDQ